MAKSSIRIPTLYRQRLLLLPFRQKKYWCCHFLLRKDKWKNGTVNICFVWYSFIDPFDSCYSIVHRVEFIYLSLDAANWCHHKHFFPLKIHRINTCATVKWRERGRFSSERENVNQLKKMCLHMWKQHFHCDLMQIDWIHGGKSSMGEKIVRKWRAKMRQNKCLVLIYPGVNCVLVKL